MSYNANHTYMFYIKDNVFDFLYHHFCQRQMHFPNNATAVFPYCVGYFYFKKIQIYSVSQHFTSHASLLHCMCLIRFIFTEVLGVSRVFLMHFSKRYKKVVSSTMYLLCETIKSI